MKDLFRHLLLRFNYGVEIGARLAYLGHYKATKDPVILGIANEELVHRKQIESILSGYGKKPTPIFNVPFTVIGNIIFNLCQVSPKWSLDFIAMSMEMFAVFNYKKLAYLYPEHFDTFTSMSEAEDAHRLYFKSS